MRNDSITRRAARFARSAFGQKRFYRAVRLLMYEARFDVLNDPNFNGERYLQRVALQFAQPPAVVFDVGANVGDWTAMLLEGGEATMVHAFEPCPGTFEQLTRNLTKHPSVTLVPAAVSDAEGVSRMNVTADGAGTNALSADGEVEVQTTTVDAYCTRNAIPHIDLLKIDAEGYDFNVLSGAKSMLSSHAVELVQFEYNHRWIENRKLLKDAFGFLLPLGYRMGKLTGDSIQSYAAWDWELETYREANYVAYLPAWQSRLQVHPSEWL